MGFPSSIPQGTTCRVHSEADNTLAGSVGAGVSRLEGFGENCLEACRGATAHMACTTRPNLIQRCFGKTPATIPKPRHLNIKPRNPKPETQTLNREP